MAAPLAATMFASRVLSREVDTRRRNEAEAASVRNATMTLLAIASAYLVCNTLSFAITLLERLPGKPGLWHYNDAGDMVARTQFYIITTDLISFLFMFNSFMRIVINIRFNPAVRTALAKPWRERKLRRAAWNTIGNAPLNNTLPAPSLAPCTVL